MRDDLLKLLEPIDGATPCGSYLRYEPGKDGLTVYDKIEDARREEADLPQGEWQREIKTADYGQVIKLATAALEKQTKDLQLAAWLTEALTRRSGIAGLLDGLELTKELLERFWDHVHPQLEDGDAEFRSVPLNWLGSSKDIVAAIRFVPLNSGGHSLFQQQEARSVGYEADIQGDSERLEARKKAIDSGKLSPEEFDEAFAATPKAWYKETASKIEGCFATLKVLGEFCDERFGDDAPSFTGAKQALEDVQAAMAQLLARKLELEPDPVEVEPAEPVAVESSAAPGAAAGAGALSLEPANREDAAALVAAAARYLQRTAPTHPASYLMLRGFRWGELRAQGSHVDPKLLAAPPTQVRTKLKGLLLDAKWSELLTSCEAVMATAHGRGWLDLQRYVLSACEALGTEYEHVTAAIRGALVELLRDLPDLPQQTLMDDTPTANAETRTWLREILAASEAVAPVEVSLGDEEQAVASVRAQRPDAKTMFDRAMAMLRSGMPEKGIELLMSRAEQEKSPRERFLRRAEAADIMVESGMASVAMPILRDLSEQIDKHQLETWEAGDTVARPLGLLYRCMSALGGGAEDAKQALYLRICRLDPLRVIAIDGKKREGTAAAPPTAAATPRSTPPAPSAPASPPVSDEQAGG